VRLLLIFLCACRFSWSTWQGAPPRTANDIKLVLYGTDETSTTIARSALSRDPHVTLIDIDPAALEQAKTDCGNASCSKVHAAACAWTAQHGADYYAVAYVGTHYNATYHCDTYKLSLSKHGDECSSGHYENESSTASYTLDVYDAKTCEAVPALAKKISSTAPGVEEQSKPEALAKLAAEVPAKSEGIPEQIMIGPSGAIVGGAQDGFYAVFRGGNYRGYVNVRGAGTPAEQLRPMYFPLTPAPGDTLVARGRRKFLDLAVDGAVGFISYDGARHPAGGIGAHIRHYKLDGGFQFGFGTDYVGSLATSSNVFLFTPEVGWGVPIAPGFVVSANLGAGWARANQLDAADMVHTAYAAHVIATARMQTFLTTWFYVTADVGYVHSGTLDDWDGTGPSGGKTMAMRSPIARVYLGFDL
jgi:hypothetical protein